MKSTIKYTRSRKYILMWEQSFTGRWTYKCWNTPTRTRRATNKLKSLSRRGFKNTDSAPRSTQPKMSTTKCPKDNWYDIDHVTHQIQSVYTKMGLAWWGYMGLAWCTQTAPWCGKSPGFKSHFTNITHTILCLEHAKAYCFTFPPHNVMA